MKTLDEVIKAMEYCENHTCGEECGEKCPYQNEGFCYEEDALHYLKEYKDYQDTMCALPDYYDWVHSADNPALTWEQLKQMEGKPVWVEFLRDGESFDEEWIIVKDINEVCMADTQGFGYTIDDYNADKGWQAYRKEKYE